MGAAAYNRGTARIRANIKSPEHVTSLPGSAVHPRDEQITNPTPPVLPFRVGEIVFCTVISLRGIENTITAVKRGYVKVSGFPHWCPESNFQREPTKEWTP